MLSAPKIHGYLGPDYSLWCRPLRAVWRTTVDTPVREPTSLRFSMGSGGVGVDGKLPRIAEVFLTSFFTNHNFAEVVYIWRWASVTSARGQFDVVLYILKEHLE